MDEKNLTPQATQPANRITIQDLPTQFVEISDKDLQQIVGGGEPASPVGGKKVDIWSYSVNLDSDVLFL